MLLSEAEAGKAYLIHDNALMFNIDYLAYNLASVRIGVEAPNMNSIMERFFESVRKEALDDFLLIGKSQVQRSRTNMSPSIMVRDRNRGAATDPEDG